MAAAAFVEVAVEVAYALHSVSILAAGDVDHCQRQYRNEDAGRHVVVRVNPLLYEPVEAAVVVATIPVDHHWGSAADSAAAAVTAVAPRAALLPFCASTCSVQVSW